MYFLEVNKKNFNFFYPFLYNIFMYTVKHYKMKIFSCKYFTLTNILRRNKQSVNHTWLNTINDHLITLFSLSLIVRIATRSCSLISTLREAPNNRNKGDGVVCFLRGIVVNDGHIGKKG